MSIFKKIPNPFWKKGGEAHQEKVKEVAKEVDSRDLFSDLENKIDLSNGSRRFIDVAGLDDNRNIVELHQIGKQTKKGLPVKRERDVIEEVSKETGIEVEFHPYND
ncbi:MAG TPA: hypothetical protein PLX69_16955 [Leptospiraceae bacterium]|nr:hypothetical protein [Leptospiraceae bacterium]